MAASYEIDQRDRVKYVKISGSTNYNELEALFLQYVKDPAFEPDLRILADLSGMSDALAGLWEIQKLKKLYQYAYRDAVDVVDVIIVAKAGVAYRAARAFKLFMRDKRPLRIHICDSLVDAQSILGSSDQEQTKLVRNKSAELLSFVVYTDTTNLDP